MSTATAERESVETFETTAETVVGTPAAKISTAIKTDIGVIDYGLVVTDLKTLSAAVMQTPPIALGDKSQYEAVKKEKNVWMKYRTKTTGVKEDFNRAAKARVQGYIDTCNEVAKELLGVVEPTEEHLKKQLRDFDEATEEAEKDKADAAFKAKNDKLLAVGLVMERRIIDVMHGIEIDDAVAKKIEDDRVKAIADKKAADDKAEAERVAAELAEKNRFASERLASERAAFEKQQAEAKAEADRLKAMSDAETARLRAEADQRVATERAKLDDERIAQEAEAARLKYIEDQRVAAERAELEKQKAELAEAQKKIAAEREAAEKKERQRLAVIERQRVEADEKEAQRVAEEQRAAREAAGKLRAEALRPDKEKLLSVAAAIHAIVIPQVSDELADAVRAINHIIVRSVREITEVAHAI